MKNKFLIIEDNDQNMYLMTFLLTKNNCEVIQATNGKEGIRLARETKPDAILLDIQLPEKDGYQVASEIQEDHTLKNIPIIAVTSYAMPGDKERILSAGATGYIEKPINPDIFFKQILEYL